MLSINRMMPTWILYFGRNNIVWKLRLGCKGLMYYIFSTAQIVSDENLPEFEVFKPLRGSCRSRNTDGTYTNVEREEGACCNVHCIVFVVCVGVHLSIRCKWYLDAVSPSINGPFRSTIYNRDWCIFSSISCTGVWSTIY